MPNDSEVKMLWIELESKIRQLLEERGLAKPSIRLNALNKLGRVIKSKFPNIYSNPDSLLQIDKNKFKEMLSQYKKLNSAESSIVNTFYQILLPQTNSFPQNIGNSAIINTQREKPKRAKAKHKPEIVQSEKEIDKPVFGLQPVIDEKTKILILGTFPAKESISANFYYQNQIKRFWGQALSYVGSFENISNDDRGKILLKKGIGLWDIFECVEREGGNQDKAITKAKYNNLHKFLNEHPSITYLIFNGSNAFEWLKDDRPEVVNREGLEIKRLQSSSGGNGHFKQGEDWGKLFAAEIR
jgi:hypoxanthine-DNA glycosylase